MRKAPESSEALLGLCFIYQSIGVAIAIANNDGAAKGKRRFSLRLPKKRREREHVQLFAAPTLRRKNITPTIALGKRNAVKSTGGSSLESNLCGLPRQLTSGVLGK